MTHRPNQPVVTQAITHIPLSEINDSKRAKLDDTAEVYLALCQQYVSYFCIEAQPDKFADPVFESILSQRWQRVAIKQAAGIAQSWRSNRENNYRHYARKLKWFEKKYPSEAERVGKKAPIWRESNIPMLRKMSIQANENVALLTSPDDLPIKLQKSNHASHFDFWIRISTLEKRKPIWIPVRLEKYHREKLGSHTPNSSVSLERRANGSWWLTLTFDQDVKSQSPTDSIGIDVGISNFITTSTGQQYGHFDERLKARHQRDREKRRRKAKLRACLEKKGIPKEQLPSTSSRTGEKLGRHVRQQINRAVNQMLADHPNTVLVIEDLDVATMRFKSKRMNAYLYASNLGHIPKKLAWESEKTGVPLHKVHSAYSSQECNRCHYTARENRPNQQTFCCKRCGYRAHADIAASINIANRLHDDEVGACTDISDVKQILDHRHQRWSEQHL